MASITRNSLYLSVVSASHSNIWILCFFNFLVLPLNTSHTLFITRDPRVVFIIRFVCSSVLTRRASFCAAFLTLISQRQLDREVLI